MSLLGLCQWLRDTAVSTGIRESLYLYPLLHWWHILSISVMFGSIVFLDLRLVGAGFRKRRVTDVAEQLLPWTWTGYVLMTLSGGLIFLSDPVRYYERTLFWIKALLMILAGINALVFHYTVYRSVASWDLDVPPARARLAGAVSITAWVAVIVTGRAVGYFS
jgi:hypothetical protein